MINWGVLIVLTVITYTMAAIWELVERIYK